MEEKSGETGLTDEELTIYGAELRFILQKCGRKQYEFAYFIDKPSSFVRQNLYYSREPIPFMYAEALSRFVGEKTYKLTLKAIRNRPIEGIS